MKTVSATDPAGTVKDVLLIVFGVLCVAGAVARVTRGEIDETTLLFVGVAAAMLVVREISSLAIGDKFKIDFRQQVQEAKDAAETATTVAKEAVDSAAQANKGAASAQSVAAAIIERRIGGKKKGPPKDGMPSVSDSATEELSANRVIDQDDPQQGKWGGKPERNGRRLSATVVPVEGDADWFIVRLTVESTDDARPLTGSVTFHLHESFDDPNPTIPVRGGLAVLNTVAYGAFTVGAEADDRTTRLELNLSALPDVPEVFRER